jgi:hypothetical protein
MAIITKRLNFISDMLNPASRTDRGATVFLNVQSHGTHSEAKTIIKQGIQHPTP